MYRPIEKKKRNFELVMDQIEGAIFNGALKPGDRLMSERDFAEKLKVSRTSIREAFRVIEALDVVEIRPGDGAILKRPSINGSITPLSLFLNDDNEAFQNIHETRMILESGIARLAAERRTKEELNQIEKNYLGIVQSTHIEDVIEADIAFHKSILEASKNPTLIYLGESLLELIEYGIRETREVLFEQVGENEISANQHKYIYEAIRDQQPEAAYHLMTEHLKYTTQKSLEIRGK
jgi:GntR family transcriptional regulator, transcriptional repressor for pyruvate dehydrogenase complex